MNTVEQLELELKQAEGNLYSTKMRAKSQSDYVSELQRQLKDARIANMALIPEAGNSGFPLTTHGGVLGRGFRVYKECQSPDGMYFSDPLTADNFADALNVLIELRTSAGSNKMLNKTDQWLITVGEEQPSRKLILKVEKFVGLTKFRSLSPCFSSYRAAMQAIDRVGRNRIMKMFGTFHGHTL